MIVNIQLGLIFGLYYWIDRYSFATAWIVISFSNALSSAGALYCNRNLQTLYCMMLFDFVSRR